VIEIYAITDTPPRDARGLTAVCGDGLVALCRQAESEQELSADQLWRHEELVESLMEECDCCRFATAPASRTRRGAEVLSDRRSELVNALDRVRGAVECHFASSSPSSATTSRRQAAPTTSGGERSVSASGSRPVPASTGTCAACTGQRERASSDPHELFREAYLVDRSDVEAFVARVAELEAANSRLRLLCTGPWPPYSFTGR